MDKHKKEGIKRANKELKKKMGKNAPKIYKRQRKHMDPDELQKHIMCAVNNMLDNIVSMHGLDNTKKGMKIWLNNHLENKK